MKNTLAKKIFCDIILLYGVIILFLFMRIKGGFIPFMFSMKGLIQIMKLKLAAIAFLAVCALCGCSNTRDASSSFYTPTPVTPRPTFDTTYYRTKEEINAKQDSEFVIYDNVKTGGYPSHRQEYDPIVITNNEALAYEKDRENAAKEQARLRAEAEKAAAAAKRNNNTSSYGSSYSSTPTYTSGNTTPSNSSIVINGSTPTYNEATPAPRDESSIPEGFSSTNYPYSLYSFDGRTYLGKITADVSDPESIWNNSGDYGSADSSTSIFNMYGIYGSSNSMFSAFNDYASAPPKIYDSRGNIVGLLTSNLSVQNGISPDTLKTYASDKKL